MRAFIATMEQPFDDSYKEIADSMGISLYQRFSVAEASLFLRCHIDELNKIQQQNRINFIQLTEDKVEFFGYQLLTYLLNSVTQNTPLSSQPFNTPDRIIRSKEVQEITGLSRTTIWRMERTGDFPDRVGLGVGSVGWKLNEVNNWVTNRKTI